MMRFLLLLLLGLGCSPFALGQMYKWKDEKGVTHYGERPPAGKDATSVELKSPTGPPPATAEKGAKSPSAPPRRQETDVQRQEREFNERHRDRTRTAEREHKDRMEQIERNEKQRQQTCASARRDLNNVKASSTGQRGYRLNEIRELENTISQNCR